MDVITRLGSAFRRVDVARSAIVVAQTNLSDLEDILADEYEWFKSVRVDVAKSELETANQNLRDAEAMLTHENEWFRKNGFSPNARAGDLHNTSVIIHAEG